jgi:5,10-methylenetetrahydromethanopterin reductase
VTFPKIGIRLHGGIAPRPSVELAVAAERNGFDAVWFAENPYNRGVFPAVAACALATSRITIGIGVFNPYNRHPTLIAMEMGALDELAQGRSTLGIGAGLTRALKKAALVLDKPIAALRDSINIVRGLMSGQAFSYDGKVFSVHDIKLEFPLLRTEYPIYMAAMGDQALRLSGEVGDGLMISNMCPPGYTRRALGLMREGAAKAAREPLTNVVQYAPCIARPDGTEARRAAKAVLGGMLVNSWSAGELSPVVRESMVRDSGIPAEDFRVLVEKLKTGGSAADLVEDRFLDRYAVAGTADDCIAAINRYADAGVTEMTLTFIGAEPTVEMAYLGGALQKLRT